MVEAGKFVDCLKEDGSDARLAMTGCVHGVLAPIVSGVVSG